jgi:mono/diheme cytochrome c family protein
VKAIEDGQSPKADAAGESASLGEESIIKILPNHGMPAFSSFLNDNDIWAALTFTKST